MRKNVRVTVHDGVVTLDGVLFSRRQAESIARAALAVPGIVGLRNNLRYAIDDVAGRGTAWTSIRP
ncbi:MAG TPA: BON domain-containing protein [Actinophytocola sp.]|jgi:osmotically-inducible protein OsmY|uniref:BON domain-containing protein n=1 Tax=Actinophytocola sp. TaxID=1872138 RepID=UPI002F943B2A